MHRLLSIEHAKESMDHLCCQTQSYEQALSNAVATYKTVGDYCCWLARLWLAYLRVYLTCGCVGWEARWHGLQVMPEPA